MEAHAARMLRDFGRSDVPSGVRAAADNLSRAHGLSLKVALKNLIVQAGSLSALAAIVEKDAKKIRRRHNRQRARAKAKTYPSAPYGSIFTHTSIVQGGAPGSGRVGKPICMTTKTPPRDL
jgi:hypothetical protein